MLIGYVRVSTEEQNTARQDEMMKALGVDKLYTDKASGKSTDRPALQEMMAFVREGDTVVVESLSRFGRSLRDLTDLIDQLNAKHVQFKSLKEGDFDTTSPHGKLIFSIMGALAQFERELILERQAEGIKAAKDRGVYKGRTPVAYDRDLLVYYNDQYLAGKLTRKEMARKLGLSYTTMFRIMAKEGIIDSDMAITPTRADALPAVPAAAAPPADSIDEDFPEEFVE